MTQQEWVGLGFNAWVAEALEGRELTLENVKASSVTEILDEVFVWHGMLGFTESIVDAVDNVRNMEGEL